MSSPGPPPSASAIARERLIEAGCQLLFEHYRDATQQMHRGLRGVLGAAAVAKRAGYKSHAVLYRVWGEEGDAADSVMELYTADVVTAIASRAHAPQSLSDAMVALRSSGVGFAAVVKLLTQFERDRLTLPGEYADGWVTWLSIAPYAFADPMRKRWAEQYRGVAQKPFAATYRLGLTLWDRQMRPGVTEEDLALALGAITDGFLIHDRLVEAATDPIDWRPDDPTDDDVPWTLMSMTVYGVMMQLSEPIPATTEPAPDDA